MNITELPDIDDTLTLRDDKHIAFITLDQDTDAENPSDWGCWEIISLSRRHSNFDADRFNKLHKDKDCVVLSYYEHGNCVWSPQGTGPQCQWDNVEVAGLWIPGDYLRDTLKKLKGKARREKALSLAAGACETYTAWCNGEVYHYAVDVYELLHDSDGAPIEEQRHYERHSETVEQVSSGERYLEDREARERLLAEINETLADVGKEVAP